VSARLDPRDLTPRRIVQELDRHIVGQDAAKRVVAIAIRNRWRRQQLAPELRTDFAPKNILLVGPTGVGKTEIARRLAQLVSAPFVKVEATRYTERGYVGRDVESIVRDLVEVAVSMVKAEELSKVQKRAEERAEERLLDALLPPRPAAPSDPPESAERSAQSREKMRAMLRAGELDGREVELTVEERQSPFMQVFSPGGMEEVGLDGMGALGNMFPSRQVVRRVVVSEARRVMAQQEAEKLVDRERCTREGLRRAQETGVVFIDEIDKIVGAERTQGPDVSRGGVQRDLLPIVEGATVNTRYGVVNTDYMLFIAAGAFSFAKPTDLIPELQGRFPLRAELKSLGREDFVRILTEPKSALLKQYAALLEVEGIRVDFRRDAVEEMAAIAAQINSSTQDIGARRLHTVVEKVLDDVSFTAPELAPAQVPIDASYVRQRLKNILEDEDLRRYIL
jgi:ATP-dependent HslUV protease ATP-binding subunit HslU